MTASIETDIAIVGAGPAGLSAALAASSGDHRVTLIDENPLAGGQIWRAQKGRLSSDARSMIERLANRESLQIIPGSQVFDAADRTLYCETQSGTARVRFEKLIIATGARELLLPFPGWTLPNVFGVGGLQALAKGGLDVSGKRIVVAGSGPLLLAVASYLRASGARIVLIAEQAPRLNVMRFGLGLWRTPAKFFSGARLMAELARVEMRFDSYAVRADGDDRLRSVTIRTGTRDERFDCDMLASGYGLVPNIELAEILGCKIENGFVAVDERQRTSVEGVFCAGELTGIGGLDSALTEGTIAGTAAVGRDAGLSRKRAAGIRFAQTLEDRYRLRPELMEIPDADTIVCRCEDATYGSMSAFAGFREAKLQTRCGMGACRGRVCGAASRLFFGWERDSARPPLVPVRVETLADMDEKL